MKYMGGETSENKLGFILCYRDRLAIKNFRQNCLKVGIGRAKER